MNRDIEKIRLLLETAELSWERFASSDRPQDIVKSEALTAKFRTIKANLTEVRKHLETNGDFAFPEWWSDARQLFWDEPSSPAESACLKDAFELFVYLNKYGSSLARLDIKAPWNFAVDVAIQRHRNPPNPRNESS